METAQQELEAHLIDAYSTYGPNRDGWPVEVREKATALYHAAVPSLKKSIGHDDGGCYAEVYTDDDGGSGYGDNARVGRWYGTRQECEAVNPGDVRLHPITTSNGADPFDLACERRFD